MLLINTTKNSSLLHKKGTKVAEDKIPIINIQKMKNLFLFFQTRPLLQFLFNLDGIHELFWKPFSFSEDTVTAQSCERRPVIFNIHS